MPFTPLVPRNAPPALAPYSAGVRAGSTIYVSGILPVGPDGSCVGEGDITAQTRYVLETVQAVLEAGGATLGDVAMNQIFLKDLKDYAAMNAVYKEFFPENPPARYCIRADLVKPEFLVEIASTAHL